MDKNMILVDLNRRIKSTVAPNATVVDNLTANSTIDDDDIKIANEAARILATVDASKVLDYLNHGSRFDLYNQSRDPDWKAKNMAYNAEGDDLRERLSDAEIDVCRTVDALLSGEVKIATLAGMPKADGFYEAFGDKAFKDIVATPAAYAASKPGSFFETATQAEIDTMAKWFDHQRAVEAVRNSNVWERTTSDGRKFSEVFTADAALSIKAHK